MSQNQTSLVPALIIRRIFNAPRTRVFAAWTQVEMLREWMCPPGFIVTEAQFDVRAGGTFRITMQYPDGEKDQWTHAQSGANYIASYGVFKEVRETERLAFTFRHEGDVADEFIDVELLDRGSETELVFKHDGFATERSRSEYEYGWPGAFEKLSSLL